MNRIPILCLFIIATHCSAVGAEPHATKSARRATLYEIGSRKTRILFHWELVENSEEKQKSRFYTSDGKLSAEDVITWEAGVFKRYCYTRFNIEERAAVEHREDRLIFTKNWKGKTRTKEEPFTENFVIGPLAISYIRKYWVALKKGEALSIQYGVPDRLRTIGFDLKCDTKASEQDTVVIKMSASSFLIRFFIDPIAFKFSPDGQILYLITGRTLPVMGKESDPKPVDAEMVFHY